MGFRVQGLGFRFWVHGSGFRVEGLGFSVSGLGLGVRVEDRGGEERGECGFRV